MEQRRKECSSENYHFAFPVQLTIQWLMMDSAIQNDASLLPHCHQNCLITCMFAGKPICIEFMNVCKKWLGLILGFRTLYLFQPFVVRFLATSTLDERSECFISLISSFGQTVACTEIIECRMCFAASPKQICLRMFVSCFWVIASVVGMFQSCVHLSNENDKSFGDVLWHTKQQPTRPIREIARTQISTKHYQYQIETMLFLPPPSHRTVHKILHCRCCCCRRRRRRWRSWISHFW